MNKAKTMHSALVNVYFFFRNLFPVTYAGVFSFDGNEFKTKKKKIEENKQIANAQGKEMK